MDTVGYSDKGEIKRTVFLLWSVVFVIALCLVVIGVGIHSRADARLKEQVVAYAHLIASSERTNLALSAEFPERKMVTGVGTGIANLSARLHEPGRSLDPTSRDQIAQEIFFPYYARLNLGPEFTAALYKDANLVFQFPSDVKDVVADDSMTRQMTAGVASGVALVRDAQDGAFKMMAFERFANNRFYARTSLPVDASMSHVRNFAVGIAASIIIMIFCGIVMTVVVLRRAGI